MAPGDRDTGPQPRPAGGDRGSGGRRDHRRGLRGRVGRGRRLLRAAGADPRPAPARRRRRPRGPGVDGGARASPPRPWCRAATGCGSRTASGTFGSVTSWRSTPRPAPSSASCSGSTAATSPPAARGGTSTTTGRRPDESLDLPTEHVMYAGELGPMPAWVVPTPLGTGGPMGGARPRAGRAARGDDPGDAATAGAGLDLPGAELPQRRGRARRPRRPLRARAVGVARRRGRDRLRRRPRRPRGAAHGVVDGRGDRAAAARPLAVVEPGLARRARRAGHRLG